MGYEIFTRYGSFLGLACILGEILYGYKKEFPYTKLLSLALINGLVFSLLNDAGIYALALSILFLFIDNLIRKLSFVKFFQKSCVYLAGFITGFTPYLVYLYINKSLGSFVSSFFELSELQQLAKTPFFHGFINLDNLFTVLILFLSLTWVCFKFYQKNRLSLATYIQVGLIISLVILEQKSIWRHIDGQLTFGAFILGSMLLVEMKDFFKSFRYIALLVYIFVSLFILFVLPFKKFVFNQGSYTCSNRFEIQDRNYLDVKKALDKTKNFNGKIFSYPGDTIFYIIFRQKPPYYPTSFEAGSKKAQAMLIDYIEGEKIDYVVYNYKNTAIQDGVPNYLRSSYLSRYIIDNFRPYKVVGNFLILHKQKNNDFFNSPIISKLPEFKNYLLTVDLENIPRSEGYNKASYLDRDHRIFGGPISYINDKLNSEKISSKDLIIEVSFKNTSSGLEKVEFIANSGETVNLMFKKCPASYSCIIDLNNLPYFYNSRIIQNISLSDPQNIKSINFYSYPYNSPFF
ncbi:MAG TPA: hypothetical protein VG917_05645 [Patescibacteria group bacterium]|nr:hypothetical protein [Patescibacteria group bacterium]